MIINLTIVECKLQNWKLKIQKIKHNKSNHSGM